MRMTPVWPVGCGRTRALGQAAVDEGVADQPVEEDGELLGRDLLAGEGGQVVGPDPARLEAQAEVEAGVLLHEELGRGVELAFADEDAQEDLGDQEVRVVGEAAADPAGAVADALGDLAGEVEEEARVLDAAGAEGVGAGADGEAGVGRVVAAEDRAGDGGERVVEAEVDEVGVEDERDPVGGLDLGPVLLGEAGRGAEAELEAVEVVAGLAHRQVGRLAGGGQVEDGVGLGPVGVEVEPGDRPAGERHPGPGHEVDGVEGAAPAAPVVRGAAEVAQAADVEVEVFQAEVGAAVGVLALLGDLEPAGLHQRDRGAGGGEAAGQRDAGGTGADHADVEAAVEGAAVDGAGVGDHDSPSGQLRIPGRGVKGRSARESPVRFAVSL